MPRFDVRVYRVATMVQSTREAYDETFARAAALADVRAGKGTVVDPDCRFLTVLREIKPEGEPVRDPEPPPTPKPPTARARARRRKKARRS